MMGQGDWPPRRRRLSCRIGLHTFSNWTATAHRTQPPLHTRSFASCFVDQNFHTAEQVSTIVPKSGNRDFRHSCRTGMTSTHPTGIAPAEGRRSLCILSNSEPKSFGAAG